MLKLMLLRHAKSSWSDPAMTDHARPLNDRGRQAAPLMGRHMARLGLVPDRILCSTALRARETLAGILPAFSAAMSIAITDDLYDASSTRIAETVRQSGGDAGTLLVIGHNPGMQETAAGLVESGDSALMGQMIGHYPTAALAVIDFDLPRWADLTAASGHLAAFMRPKDLG
ncbi:SixA phosphatase family protein [Amorphus orientalis]|uniref:Phosphohistidine phosphatase n=1 Tax=Amorphus orientalis TaxID=649198 RepID=A0AAE3VSS6_9HYPH|nr:histidine phosphatase family protein [Amorphus orientalis]MDQ0317525.1 phosphohistidine phosphatase [Amorphus orientalis]